MFIRVTNQLSAKVAQNVLIKIHEKINIELHAQGLHIKYYKNSNEQCNFVTFSVLKISVIWLKYPTFKFYKNYSLCT